MLMFVILECVKYKDGMIMLSCMNWGLDNEHTGIMIPYSYISLQIKKSILKISTKSMSISSPSEIFLADDHVYH
jgi:hypothetical protein